MISRRPSGSRTAMPTDCPFSRAGCTAASIPAGSLCSPQDVVIDRDALGWLVGSAAVEGFSVAALVVSVPFGAPPLAHAVINAISNGDNDGSLLKSPYPRTACQFGM